jgi:hypothetical protein
MSTPITLKDNSSANFTTGYGDDMQFGVHKLDVLGIWLLSEDTLTPRTTKCNDCGFGQRSFEYDLESEVPCHDRRCHGNESSPHSTIYNWWHFDFLMGRKKNQNHNSSIPEFQMAKKNPKFYVYYCVWYNFLYFEKLFFM